ncbi:Trp biosynthesis-associated membrane protein [Plantactinospora siamensis]|uniref:Trp biosynthesis-associated membrane protein n=1 Tax=Plantactinospora siamensis TaxID=555372 RepID=A0ABV6P1H3_9ACTN
MSRLAGGRGLAYAVLALVAGAGLALYAATRTWSVERIARPPLPPTRVTHTGGALLPWLPALAVVALAGAGALLATRGRPRRFLGAGLTLAGLGVAAGGGYALAGGATPATGGAVSATWPALSLLGGLLAAAGAALAARYGHRWPAMGARYERAGSRPAPDGRVAAGNTREAWDALDRGEDPTAG